MDVIPFQRVNEDDAVQPDEELELPLDGAFFILRRTWNLVDQSWYLSVYSAAREPIWLGHRVAVGVPILAQCVSALRPAGELIAFDTANRDEDPGLSDFGEGLRVQLFYGRAEEVAALGGT